MSSIVNKVKEAISSDHHKSSQPEGTHGQHNTRAANAADPRIDSDRDHRAAHHTTTTGTEGAFGSSGPEGTYSSTREGAYDSNRGVGGPASRTDGPHNSNVLNKADPRVDSDRDYSRNMGANPHGTANTGTTGSSILGGQHSTTTGTSGLSEGSHGPHGSRAANAVDPRVDSDLDGSRNLGSNRQTNPGNTFGTHQSEGFGQGTNRHTTTGNTFGTHQSEGFGQGTTHNTTGSSYGTGEHAATRATGPAGNTAGPHKSDMLNKADPRVDSNLDGSKTVGGDKTFAQDNFQSRRIDPTDAAQAPPSVLQKHIGKPEIAHDDHTHERERRHSINNQERHTGL